MDKNKKSDGIRKKPMREIIPSRKKETEENLFFPREADTEEFVTYSRREEEVYAGSSDGFADEKEKEAPYEPDILLAEEEAEENEPLISEQKTAYEEKTRVGRASESSGVILKGLGESFFEKAGRRGAKRNYIRSFVPKSPILLGAASGAVAVVTIFILLSTMFVRVTVAVKPLVESFSVQDVSFVLDTSAPRADKRVIPAQKFEITGSAEMRFDASGRMVIEEKARGAAKIYNSFSSSPQTLVASTRFVTDSGLLYRLTKNTVVPAAEIREGKIVPRFVEAELMADQPGEEYNSSTELTLRLPAFQGTDRYQGFYGVVSSFTGGYKGEAKVVSGEDLKSAQEQVTKQVYEELKSEVNKKIPQEFRTADSFREIQITGVTSPQPNSRHDTFTVEAKAAARVLAFRERDLEELFKDIILGGDAGKEILPDFSAIQYRAREIDFEKGKAEGVISGSLRAKSLVSEQKLKDMIREKKEGTAIEILKQEQNIASFSVSFFPPWVSRVPSNAEKIRVKIE